MKLIIRKPSNILEILNTSHNISVQFGNKEEVVDPEEFCNYHCMVNAVDGSTCGAYSLSGDVGLYWDIDDIVWYEH